MAMEVKNFDSSHFFGPENFPQTSFRLRGSHGLVRLLEGPPRVSPPISSTPITLSACDLHFVETKQGIVFQIFECPYVLAYIFLVQNLKSDPLFRLDEMKVTCRKCDRGARK